MDAHLSMEQTKELRALCERGKLYEIERRFAILGTVCPHPTTRREPLSIAIDKGFHSLVEFLIKHTRDLGVKNKALKRAVALRNFDLTQLLVDYGADPLSVCFTDVLCAYNPDMTRYFVAKGADLIKGHPFAIAFQEKIRTSLGVFIDCQRNNPNLKAELQRQLDMALGYHCGRGNMRWVSLLLWAGGNPCARVPDLNHPDDMDDEELWITGVEEAAYCGQLDVIKKIGVTPQNALWQKALSWAAFAYVKAIVKFLLEAGINPNDKPNGGCSGLDNVLTRLSSEGCGYRLASKAGTAIEISELLLQHGAHWVPDDVSSVNCIRRSFYEVADHRPVELLKLMVKYKASEMEFLQRFVSTPKMTTMLGGKDKIAMLLAAEK